MLMTATSFGEMCAGVGTSALAIDIMHANVQRVIGRGMNVALHFFLRDQGQASAIDGPNSHETWSTPLRRPHKALLDCRC
jgi:hypothetical protein